MLRRCTQSEHQSEKSRTLLGQFISYHIIWIKMPPSSHIFLIFAVIGLNAVTSTGVHFDFPDLDQSKFLSWTWTDATQSWILKNSGHRSLKKIRGWVTGCKVPKFALLRYQSNTSQKHRCFMSMATWNHRKLRNSKLSIADTENWSWYSKCVQYIGSHRVSLHRPCPWVGVHLYKFKSPQM